MKVRHHQRPVSAAWLGNSIVVCESSSPPTCPYMSSQVNWCLLLLTRSPSTPLKYLNPDHWPFICYSSLILHLYSPNFFPLSSGNLLWSKEGTKERSQASLDSHYLCRWKATDFLQHIIAALKCPGNRCESPSLHPYCRDSRVHPTTTVLPFSNECTVKHAISW